MPPPPWTCRLRAVVRLRAGRRHLTALACIAYLETPVGPYGEALLAEVGLSPTALGRALSPLRVTVPWIVVDSARSLAGGQRHWGLPKQPATFTRETDGQPTVVHAPGTVGDGLHLQARGVGLGVPVAGAAVLRQPGRGPAPLRFRGRARPALVRATGGPAPGAGPGALLDGVLRLDAPRPPR